jgi:AraC-like DNA-binding protein
VGIVIRENLVFTITILLTLSLAATAAFLAYLPGFAFQKHSMYNAGSVFDHLYQQQTASVLLANSNQPTLPGTYSRQILASRQSGPCIQQKDLHLSEAITKQPSEKRQAQLNDPQLQEIKERLQKLIQEDKVFLKKRYTITELSTQMQISVHLLSAFINQQFGMNFNDFINRLRISYSKELIDSGNATQLNIFGLAAKCGFNNRNTFTTAFKKYIGKCPSEYLNKNVAHTTQPIQ